MPSISIPAGIGTALSAAGSVAGGLLGGMGGSKPAGNTTSTQTTVPWDRQQPYLLNGFEQAAQLQQGGGPQHFPGQSYAGPNAYQTGSVDALAQYGANPSALGGAANGAAINTLNGSNLYGNPANSTFASAASGDLGVGTSGLYSPIASGAYQNTAGVDPLSQIASGGISNTGGLGTLLGVSQNGGAGGATPQTINDFASGKYLMADNPYFQKMADRVKAQVQPGIDAQFANGRLDSGLASRAVGEGLGDALGGLAYQNYQQGLGQMLGAAGQQADIGQRGTSNQLQAAQGLGQLAQQNIGNQAGAAQALSGIGQQNIGNMLSATQGLSGIGATNAGLQLSGAQGLSGNYNTGQDNILRTQALAPSLQGMDLQRLGALQSAGDALQGYEQGGINDAMNRYNFNQERPYDALQRYMSLIQGNYGGTTTSQQPYFQNGLANTLSGALGGAGLGKMLLGMGGGGGGLASFLGSGGFGDTAGLGIAGGLI